MAEYEVRPPLRVSPVLLILLGALIGSAMFWVPSLFANQPGQLSNAASVQVENFMGEYIGGISYFTSILLALITLFVAANFLWVIDQHRYFDRIAEQHKSMVEGKLEEFEKNTARDIDGTQRKIARHVSNYECVVRLKLQLETCDEDNEPDLNMMYAQLRKLEQSDYYECIPIVSRIKKLEVSEEISSICDRILAKAKRN